MWLGGIAGARGIAWAESVAKRRPEPSGAQGYARGHAAELARQGRECLLARTRMWWICSRSKSAGMPQGVGANCRLIDISEA
jgi:hypothetical protein